MVHDEIHNMMKNAEENMKNKVTKQIKSILLMRCLKKDAKNMVTLRLLVQEFIKENSITASDDEVKK